MLLTTLVSVAWTAGRYLHEINWLKFLLSKMGTCKSIDKDVEKVAEVTGVVINDAKIVTTVIHSTADAIATIAPSTANNVAKLDAVLEKTDTVLDTAKKVDEVVVNITTKAGDSLG